MKKEHDTWDTVFLHALFNMQAEMVEALAVPAIEMADIERIKRTLRESIKDPHWRFQGRA